VSLLICIVYSGFAYPLHYGSGFWPFNRDWFMFSYDTGYDYFLQAEAETKAGAPMILDVSPHFGFAIGSASNRFQEVPRDFKNMKRLAEFLCANYPIQTISLIDYSWQRPIGRRLELKEIAPAQLSKTTWVERFQCSL
jgi:hypothetical protein